MGQQGIVRFVGMALVIAGLSVPVAAETHRLNTADEALDESVIEEALTPPDEAVAEEEAGEAVIEDPAVGEMPPESLGDDEFELPTNEVDEGNEEDEGDNEDGEPDEFEFLGP